MFPSIIPRVLAIVQSEFVQCAKKKLITLLALDRKVSRPGLLER
jgi:hypothetical protein